MPPQRAFPARLKPIARELGAETMRHHARGMRAGREAFVTPSTVVAAAISSLEAGVPAGDPEIDGASLQMIMGSGTQCNDLVGPLIDLWIAEHGALHALESLDRSTRFTCVGGFGQPSSLTATEDASSFGRGTSFGWNQLRARLSAESDATWNAAHARASQLRVGAPLSSRMALSYLFPDEPSWSDEDAREALRAAEDRVRYAALAHLAPTVEIATLEALIAWRGSWVGEARATVASMVMRFGGAATPIVVRYLDAEGWVPDKGAQRACAEALVWLGTPEAATALAERLDMKSIASIVVEAFLARPSWAKPALEARSHDAKAKTLLAMVLRAEPSQSAVPT